METTVELKHAPQKLRPGGPTGESNAKLRERFEAYVTENVGAE
jgi:hypothetical protein